MPRSFKSIIDPKYIKEANAQKHYESSIDLISSKTTLSNKEIMIILDVIIFFLKRQLIRKRSITIRYFGRVSIKNQKVYFKANRIFKNELNGSSAKEPCRRICRIKRQDFLKQTASVFNVKYENMDYIFRLFIYGLKKFLLEKFIVRIRFFGSFYIKPCNWAGRFPQKGKIYKKAGFRASALFIAEFKEKKKDIFLLGRARKIINLVGVT